MTDSTKNLRSFQPRIYPTIAGGEAQFITEEHKRIADALMQCIAALKALDARMQAAGI
jgi:hypothetical protein